MVDRIRTRLECYDPTEGKWGRVVNKTDVDNLTVIDASPAAGNITLAGSITVPANTYGLLIGYNVTVVGAGGYYRVRAQESGGDRIAVVSWAETGNNVQGTAGEDAPFIVIDGGAAGTTVTQQFNSAGGMNITASIAMVIVPKYDKKETE